MAKVIPMGETQGALFYWRTHRHPQSHTSQWTHTCVTGYVCVCLLCVRLSGLGSDTHTGHTHTHSNIVHWDVDVDMCMPVFGSDSWLHMCVCLYKVCNSLSKYFVGISRQQHLLLHLLLMIPHPFLHLLLLMSHLLLMIPYLMLHLLLLLLLLLMMMNLLKSTFPLTYLLSPLSHHLMRVSQLL